MTSTRPSNRIKALLALVCTTLSAAGTVGILGVPATARADSCNYWDRLGTQNINIGQGYVGYVELLYDPGCRRTEAHFHTDSSWRASHSGWNVTMDLLGGFNGTFTTSGLESTPYPNNTSYADYYSASSSIYGRNGSPYFTADLLWYYNGCSLERTSLTWDFDNGQAYTNYDGSGNC
ncbi:hypothetical protein GCM10029978_047880 [Actinoallomurus acanthiterrae]